MPKVQLDRLHGFAREMRNLPTEPEKRLWRNLSNSRLLGFKFRRQATVGSFIADFLCPQKQLIVEVDGSTHEAGRDARRDAALGELGYTVLHVSNGDVMRDMPAVLATILITLERLPDVRPERPHPNPSPEGEGLLEATSNA